MDEIKRYSVTVHSVPIPGMIGVMILRDGEELSAEQIDKLVCAAQHMDGIKVVWQCAASLCLDTTNR